MARHADLSLDARLAEQLRTLRHARANGLGWAGSPADVVEVVTLLERGDAERARMARRIGELEGQAERQRHAPDVAAALHAGAAERFPDCPPWVGVLLEEFRQEWVERGRDAARRAVAWAMRQVHVDPHADSGLSSVRDPGPADLERALEDARLRLDRQELATRPPEGLTIAEVLGALREGFDDEALLAATSAGRPT